jgi:phytoene dehydrogenase-like protein
VGARRSDAIVVGSGPNGLAAAIELARAGWAVTVLEAEPTLGGGARTEELTLPGFRHDLCSAFHPLAVASPFFRSLPLERHGLEWVHPTVPLAHPLDGGRAVVLDRSVDATAVALGGDGPAYRRLFGPLMEAGEDLFDQLLGPLRPPRHPIGLARFGLLGFRSARALAMDRFDGEAARALFGGAGAHSFLPLERPVTAAFALALLWLGHLVGWPVARGGSQAIADALASYLRELGGAIECDRRVASIDALPAARAYVFDVTPRQLDAIAGARLPARYRRGLRRYRYGPGVFKVDFALDRPIPWTAQACGGAGTVHVGGTLEEIADGEASVWRGEQPERPFVLVGQQSRFDPTRAPEGKQTVWAYCHVPNGSTFDMTERIESQIERFAPGFRDLILAKRVMAPRDVQARNANHVGGDINGGVQDLGQLFTRPVARVSPYSTPADGVFICSSSTPPGGGVHGMCGYFAARAVLSHDRRSRV